MLVHVYLSAGGLSDGSQVTAALAQHLREHCSRHRHLLGPKRKNFRTQLFTNYQYILASLLKPTKP